ncbi:DUF4326 domain-containing protein [Emticicia sp. BO119]|uniref:DUF4326 domain-containing protein n=1 Tax=Emticicia sp. BO119 TaxID=2757768 RepID=UPI0015F0FD97|nr:DUF4326 domain-containing protein [Emticicia sp. BO119]MBA4852047.1 DUF4326 domain-containing protein [Emticicia sp. BO119]
MTTNPTRIQRKRTKGFKLPANTVCVTRGTRWGNPFKIGETMTREESIEKFKQLISNEETLKLIKQQLKGKNLACYCPVGVACHGDLLLEIANS